MLVYVCTVKPAHTGGQYFLQVLASCVSFPCWINASVVPRTLTRAYIPQVTMAAWPYLTISIEETKSDKATTNEFTSLLVYVSEIQPIIRLDRCNIAPCPGP